MKIRLQLLLMLGFTFTFVVCQGDEVKKEIQAKFNFRMNEDGDYHDQKPKLGVYLEDMDFEDAYEMHYPECYGVLISSVISGGNAHKAGLTDNDIIMEFDGEQIRYEDHLVNLRNTKKIG